MVEAEDVSAPVRTALRRYREERAAAMGDCRRLLGLNELDVQALLYVDENPGVRPSILREHLGITSAGVTTLVDRLVQRDILRRELDDTDRRVSHIFTVVDITSEPWNCLTRFDDLIEHALSAAPTSLQHELADTLNAAVTTAAASLAA